jgi:hypothetical protein
LQYRGQVARLPDARDPGKKVLVAGVAVGHQVPGEGSEDAGASSAASAAVTAVPPPPRRPGTRDRTGTPAVTASFQRAGAVSRLAVSDAICSSFAATRHVGASRSRPREWALKSVRLSRAG